MRILYVITGLMQGGAESTVCELADKMYEKGHEVKIAYLKGDIYTLPNNVEIELIKIGLADIFSIAKAYLKLSKLVRSYKPDVIHSHMVHANLLTRLVRIVTPMNKLISTAHSSNEGSFALMIGYRLTHNLANITTNISITAVNAFEEKRAVPRNGMSMLYNGVNFEKFKNIPKSKENITEELGINMDIKLILAVGRFNQAKNYPNLLMAIKILKEKNYLNLNFRLIIAGDGELRNLIEQTIIDYDIDNEVILLGRRNDIPILMSACDLFVLSSDYEGLPTVLIEALACQANIVSTNVSGVNEIVDKYGVIVPVRDPKTLSEAIEESFQYKYKNELGCKFVRAKFDINIISNEWVNIYTKQ